MPPTGLDAIVQRLAELYKDDGNMRVELLMKLTIAPDAEVTKIWTSWKTLLDSPELEKKFLQGVVAGLGSMVPAAGGSSSRQPAPQRFQLFWQALLRLPPIVAGSFLTLPSNVNLLGRDLWGSSLLVRHCYRGIFDRMMGLHSSNGKKRFVITGTPGIGKSFFAVVLMGWLVQEMGVSTFLVEFQAKRYLFTREGTDKKVEVGSITDFMAELEDPLTWWIVDMGKGEEVPACTVLLASPDQQRYKEFLKFPGSSKLYMPVWSNEEIEECRMQLYPNLDKEEVEKLVTLWGKVPRYVLEKAREEWTLISLKETISKCKWEDIISCIGEPEAAPEASHKLVHLEVVDDKLYNKRIMMPASSYVVEQMEQKAGHDHVKQLENLIHLSIGTPAYAATAGVFFEHYAHRRLQEGGSFEVRQLYPPKRAPAAENIQILNVEQCSGIHTFYKLQEIKEQGDNIYCVPSNHNFPAVDSIMQPQFLFQMTTTQKEEVKVDTLNAAAHQLRSKKPRLYFVVPARIFLEFKFVRGIPTEIEQWVLKVKGMK
ncbi:hypothetical protein Vafri_17298 [Volvox africanus]|nr:hypothetical protein Vafri_17298 [Volvox africanus]